MRLQGKSAIVTGAASGIGRAIALKFGREGAEIVAADIDGEAATGVAEAIQSDGGFAIGLHVDITNRGDTNAMAEAAMDRFGKIDALVNNAGSGSIAALVRRGE